MENLTLIIVYDEEVDRNSESIHSMLRENIKRSSATEYKIFEMKDIKKLCDENGFQSKEHIKNLYFRLLKSLEIEGRILCIRYNCFIGENLIKIIEENPDNNYCNDSLSIMYFNEEKEALIGCVSEIESLSDFENIEQNFYKYFEVIHNNSVDFDFPKLAEATHKCLKKESKSYYNFIISEDLQTPADLYLYDTEDEFFEVDNNIIRIPKKFEDIVKEFMYNLSDNYLCSKYIFKDKK